MEPEVWSSILLASRDKIITVRPTLVNYDMIQITLKEWEGCHILVHLVCFLALFEGRNGFQWIPN